MCPVILSKIQFKKQSIHVGIVRLAVAAVIMGDLNAVYAVEAAHRRQLLSAGSLQTRTMLIPGCAFPRSATIGDVFMDDLVILAMVHFFSVALEG